MLWIKAFHLIFMVTWFAGLFYLPRLFVYHTQTTHDVLGYTRFCLMEKKLYYFIMTPAAILTTIFGLWLLSLHLSLYQRAGWMHTKLLLVGLLWGYHLYCGHLVSVFKRHKNHYSARFYRFFNEIPTFFLISIILLAVIKP